MPASATASPARVDPAAPTRDVKTPDTTVTPAGANAVTMTPERAGRTPPGELTAQHRARVQVVVPGPGAHGVKVHLAVLVTRVGAYDLIGAEAVAPALSRRCNSLGRPYFASAARGVFRKLIAIRL